MNIKFLNIYKYQCGKCKTIWVTKNFANMCCAKGVNK